MTVLHLLAATTLVVVTVVLIVSVVANSDQLDDRLVILGGIMGLGWAVVLFSGFLQLGSQYSPPGNILYKFGATVLGGFIGLSAVFGRIKGLLNNFFFVTVQLIALLAFCFSFYWALS